jgi:hypothetical protein
MAPVSSRSRSARVDFPWSIWAIIEKFRMVDCKLENPTISL